MNALAEALNVVTSLRRLSPESLTEIAEAAGGKLVFRTGPISPDERDKNRASLVKLHAAAAKGLEKQAAKSGDPKHQTALLRASGAHAVRAAQVDLKRRNLKASAASEPQAEP